jgi:hypothetical protein
VIPCWTVDHISSLPRNGVGGNTPRSAGSGEQHGELFRILKPVPTPGQRDVDSAVRRLDDILMTVFYLVAILIIVGMLDVAFNVSPY